MMWIGYSAHTMRLSICMKTLHNLLYLGGYDTKDKMWREFVLSPKQTVNDVAVMHVYLQRLDPRSVIALTDFGGMGNVIVKHPVGMHKPLNRVGDAYGWPYVRYSLLQPIVGRFIQPEWR